MMNQRQFMSALLHRAASPAVLLNPLRWYPMARAAGGALTVNEGDHIWVRGAPAQVLGLQPVFEQLCQVIGPVCDLGTFPDLTDYFGGVAP